MKTKQAKRTQWGLPWYRSSRDIWYITTDVGKKVPLVNQHGDVIRGRANRPAAMATWKAMMALGSANRLGGENPVRVVLELFLQYVEREHTSKTLKTYVGFFQSFQKSWPDLLCRDFASEHIEQWWSDRHPKWGSSTRNLCGAAFKAAFRWATVTRRLLANNPLDGWKVPPMRTRSHAVNVLQTEFDGLLGLIQDECLRDILTVLWWTGTRPVNLIRATAANLHLEGKALLFDAKNTDPQSKPHKTYDKDGRPLFVPLPEAARQVINKLARRHPTGPLFRSPRLGTQWTNVRLANLIAYYACKAGLKGRFMAYACRHSKVTSMLEAGHSHGDVAAFVGNTPQVIQRNYSHVAANVERLRAMGEVSKGT